MEEQNFLGQGMNALVPPRNQSSNQSIKNDGLFIDSDLEEIDDDALEEKISEKINNTFSNFEQSEKQGSDFEQSEKEGSYFEQSEKQGSDFKQSEKEGSYFEQSEKQGSDFEQSEKQGSCFSQEMVSPINSIKQEFQKDFQPNRSSEDFKKSDSFLEAETEKGAETNEKEEERLSEIKKNPLEEKIFNIETEKIKPNSQQPRKIFSEETIKELADSIREYGILEPLVVVRAEKDTITGAEVEYELIAGERRLMAAKSLGLPTVPVIIRKPIEEQKKLELALIENIQREDLTPISKARAFARLINDFGLTQQSLAERIGKSRESIANTLRLLQLSHETQVALEQGRINEGHARALLLFSNSEKRRVFLREILAKNLSGREALELAQHYLSLNTKKDSLTRRRNLSLDPQDLELKEKLEDLLQTPVLIKKKGNQGAIEIKFFSQQDLDKILNKIFPL